MMRANDLERRFLLDVDAAGNVTVRERGKGKSGGGLPVFSTDTHEQAKALIVRHCRLARDGSGLYTLNDPPRAVESLGDVSDLFRTTYRRHLGHRNGRSESNR
jgi:hypothetical protein